MQQLNKRDSAETTRTLKEDQVSYLIKQECRIKVLRSFWIMKRNVDFFVPSLCGQSSLISKQSFKGLVIEVDGDIHNHQFKMNRDNSKYLQLHKLNIAVHTVENEDLKRESFRAFLRHMKSLPQLDSRGRKRVLRNVYLATLAAHQNDFNLSSYLNSDQISVINEIGELR